MVQVRKQMEELTKEISGLSAEELGRRYSKAWLMAHVQRSLEKMRNEDLASVAVVSTYLRSEDK